MPEFIGEARVVLADDHDLIRSGMKLLLGSVQGLNIVAEASSGAELLAAVRVHKPDLVVTDISMPDGTGLEVIEQLRQEGQAVKVIIVSLYDTPDQIRRALRAGANGFLLKGASATEIEYAVRQVLNGGEYFTARVSQRLAEPEDLRPHDVLTERQLEVLKRLALGQSSKQIGFDLNLSSKTVDVHRAAIMSRLGLRDLPSLTLYAVRVGLIDPLTGPAPLPPVSR